MNNILFIGLNGYAGSGKDTLAKALRIMLDNDFTSFEEFLTFYNEHEGYSTNNHFKYATYSGYNSGTSRCMCIAFADQLKTICANLFGIPTDRFYYNKGNSFVCVNKDFEYTEDIPVGHIINAKEFYYNNDMILSSDERYYMSLREILVYVGTYLIQQNVNRLTFINIVNNQIIKEASNNKNLNYVICTDVRFQHEFDYIKKKHGIMINIVRDDVKQLDNVAEHNFDDADEDEFDYIIENNSTYEDMFLQMWNIIHVQINEFNNMTENLATRDNTHNYVRLIDTNNDDTVKFEICTEYPIRRIGYSENQISLVDLQGGPLIEVNDYLQVKHDNEQSEENGRESPNYFVQKINCYDDFHYTKYVIICRLV